LVDRLVGHLDDSTERLSAYLSVQVLDYPLAPVWDQKCCPLEILLVIG